MKIVHIIDDMSMGGAQSLLVDLVPAQIELGDEVEVVQLRESKDKTLSDKLIEQGIIVTSFSTTRSVRNPLNIISILRIISKYDVIHAHLFPTNYWTAFAKLLKGSRRPIVTTEHSTDNKRRHNKILKKFDSFIYGRYDEIIACGDKVGDIFKSIYPNAKCISIPNGVNVKRYINATHYDRNQLIGENGDDLFLTVMVSRFIPSKRQDTLVRALKQLPQRHHAVFVGGQSDDFGVKKIKTLVNELGIKDRVHFLYLRPDVPEILKTCDAIVLSSEYEGLSLSSIEGMASGRPFIASNVNGLKEIVEGAGILVECGNPEELASELSKLAADKKYYDETVRKCIARAEMFDISTVAQKYREEYLKIINSK